MTSPGELRAARSAARDAIGRAAQTLAGLDRADPAYPIAIRDLTKARSDEADARQRDAGSFHTT